MAVACEVSALLETVFGFDRGIREGEALPKLFFTNMTGYI